MRLPPFNPKGESPMKRQLALATVLLTAASCTTTQQAETKAAAAASKEERMRIGNQPPFDVAVCTQGKGTPSTQPANDAILVGALLTARPDVMECLVHPKHRGAAESTRVVVKTTVGPQGGTHAVSGENLTPEGTACIQKAVDMRVPLAALPKGAKPVESESVFVHEATGSASVKFGLNPGSDYSGTVRLAQTNWCDCYAAFATKAPPIIKANVDLKKQQPAKDAAKDAPAPASTATVTVDPVGTPEGEQLASCLQGKMAALPSSKLDTDEVKFPYRFVHFNSRATEPSASLPPEMRFFQLELERTQRSADTAMALGARANAADAYDAIVNKYKSTGSWKLVDELKAKCKVLVDSAQTWVNTIDTQLKTDEASLALATELKASNEGWADVEKRMTEVVDGTRKDKAGAEQRLTDDQNACPKERTEPAPKKAPKK